MSTPFTSGTGEAQVKFSCVDLKLSTVRSADLGVKIWLYMTTYLLVG